MIRIRITEADMSNVLAERFVSSEQTHTAQHLSAGYVNLLALVMGLFKLLVMKEIYFIFIGTTPCWKNYSTTPENSEDTTTVPS